MEYQIENKSTQLSRIKKIVEDLENANEEKALHYQTEIYTQKEDARRKIDTLNNLLKDIQHELT